MNLKLIPVEQTSHERSCKTKKQFNPGTKINKKSTSSLKDICFRLVRYINREGRFTFEQVDELIVSMQHSILRLQKKKQEILKNRNKNGGFQKKRIK